MRSSFFRCWLGRGATDGALQVRPARRPRRPRRQPSPTVAPDSCCLDDPALRPTVTPAAAGSAAAGLDAPVFAQEPLLLDIIVFFFVTTRESRRDRRFSPPRRWPIPRPATAPARPTPPQPPRAPEASAIIRPARAGSAWQKAEGTKKAPAKCRPGLIERRFAGTQLTGIRPMRPAGAAGPRC